MTSLNKVQIIGRLGRDPEIRTFQNGGKVANLRVATSEKWKDKNTGEARERTEWHAVTVHQENAIRFIEQYLGKGALIYVEGQLETRKWQDQAGNDRYSTEVVVRPYSGNVRSLQSGRDSGGHQQPQNGGQAVSGQQSAPAGGGMYDDEIPF